MTDAMDAEGSDTPPALNARTRTALNVPRIMKLA